MEHGERRTFERGETLEEAGEPAQWVAFVERGCFKYMVHNDEEGKDYCTGFAFEGEFVADYPNCLSGKISEVSSFFWGQMIFLQQVLPQDVFQQVYGIWGSSLPARM